ncbi:MAG: polymerase sigma factor, sigma-70 family [Gemmatimonadetes bacterium]|nr:polymerase sigma factor, sigma-70 family [Gemmatimonadota bacterium]
MDVALATLMPYMDEPELRRAIERHHAECFGWAMACSGRDRAEAEDVLQTSYLKMLDGRASFDGRASLKTWIFGVIRLTSIEERRRRLFRLQWREHQANSLPVSLEQPAIEGLDDTQRSAELVAALASLAFRQREVLQLVFYHDMRIEDAAHVMRVSVGTARTHYERGKANLRARLRNMER